MKTNIIELDHNSRIATFDRNTIKDLQNDFRLSTPGVYVLYSNKNSEGKIPIYVGLSSDPQDVALECRRKWFEYEIIKQKCQYGFLLSSSIFSSDSCKLLEQMIYDHIKTNALVKHFFDVINKTRPSSGNCDILTLQKTLNIFKWAVIVLKNIGLPFLSNDLTSINLEKEFEIFRSKYQNGPTAFMIFENDMYHLLEGSELTNNLSNSFLKNNPLCDFRSNLGNNQILQCMHPYSFINLNINHKSKSFLANLISGQKLGRPEDVLKKIKTEIISIGE